MPICRFGDESAKGDAPPIRYDAEMFIFKLALHWQILIGMVLGTVIGVTINQTGSVRQTTIDRDLPNGIESVDIVDHAGTIDWTVKRSSGDVSKHRVAVIASPSDDDVESFRSLAAMQDERPELVELYQTRARSVASRFGDWTKRLGDLFLRMLKMVAVPLIITSLLTGILNLGGGGGVGRMFRRTLLYYLATSALAITTGLLVVNLVRPGLGVVGFAGSDEAPHAASLGEVLFGQIEALIPANLFAAFVEPNFLSIIAFTIAFGLFTLRVGGVVAERIGRAADATLAVMMSMTTAIIALAPLGVFFLIASVTATQGSEVFKALAYYVIAVAIALAVHAFVTLPLILKFVAKRRPTEFAKAMSPALLTAFSSASSNGTLPLTLNNVEQRAGVSNKTGSFVLPLGATINMDGTALYEVVAVMFIAQLHFGVNLPLGQQLIVALTALLASVGAAGIPHAGLVMMAIILQAVGLPAELQGVILAVDRVLDMGRTAVNVWSDSCGCAVIDSLELSDAASPGDDRSPVDLPKNGDSKSG